MSKFPYYTEPSHDNSGVTGGLNARDTSVSSAEGRLIVDVVDKINLLEPTQHPLTALLTNVDF
ncbi:MAG: hypothetical protein WCW29_04315 [Candidatus Paceibacterota bacterium]|jgi:hypothetical protein